MSGCRAASERTAAPGVGFWSNVLAETRRNGSTGAGVGCGSRGPSVETMAKSTIDAAEST
jgi:hypothetical protein